VKADRIGALVEAAFFGICAVVGVLVIEWTRPLAFALGACVLGCLAVVWRSLQDFRGRPRPWWTDDGPVIGLVVAGAIIWFVIAAYSASPLR
jgi:hypothetical protein